MDFRSFAAPRERPEPDTPPPFAGPFGPFSLVADSPPP